MVEPVNRWQPVTDLYKAEAEAAAQPAQAQAANQDQTDANIIRQVASQKTVEKKAPLGIRIFTWYLFCRAGIYALLLFVLASFPQAGVSTWLEGNLGDILHMPRSAASEMAARQKEMEKEAEAQGYTLPDTTEADRALTESSPDAARTRVMVYLLFLLATTSVVAFMWWNRSWKIRWITMFYAGAFVARASIAYVVLFTGQTTIPLPPGLAATLVLSIGLNALIFCYLAFWPDVKQWFEEEA